MSARSTGGGVPVGRQARVLVLQLLYAHDLRGRYQSETKDWLWQESVASVGARRAAENMATGIVDDAGTLDRIIARYATALPVELLPPVDRNILRVAIYELTNRGQAPRNVIINEAVELASMFGSESSSRFVNGVLGSIASDMPEPVDTAGD